MGIVFFKQPLERWNVPANGQLVRQLNERMAVSVEEKLGIQLNATERAPGVGQTLAFRWRQIEGGRQRLRRRSDAIVDLLFSQKTREKDFDRRAMLEEFRMIEKCELDSRRLGEQLLRRPAVETHATVWDEVSVSNAFSAIMAVFAVGPRRRVCF